MKQILLFLSLVLFQTVLSAQVKTAGINYSVGAPAWTPSVSTGSEFAIDTVAKRIYLWNRTTATWEIQGQGIDVVSGGTAPAYTPSQTDSKFAINNVNALYYYTGGTWVQINAGASYTAGTGIAISGSNVISTTAITALTGDVTASGPGSAVATIATASASVRGLLSSTDWNTFNGKLGGGGTLNYLLKLTGASNLGNSLLFDNGTQVGFNTNSPEATFHVKKSDVSGSASGGSFGFLIEDGSTNAVFGIQSDASRYCDIVFGDQGGLARGGLRYSLTSRSTNRRQLQFFTNGFGASSMVIDSTSKVGVNNSAPESQFHVTQTDVSGTFPTGYAFGLEHNNDDVVMAMKTNSIRSSRIWFGDNTNNNLGGILYYGSTHSSLPNHLQFWTNGAQRTWLDETGRFGIGVDPAARLHVQGAGATSSTLTADFQNSAGTTALRVRDDLKVAVADGIICGPITGFGGIFNNTTASGKGIIVRGNYNLADTGDDIIFDNAQGDPTHTSGVRTLAVFRRGFSPTSGTGEMRWSVVNPTINQTGGASGASIGFLAAPTLTSANSWRSFEYRNNSGWGIYGVGTAPSYFAGDLRIGTTTASATNITMVRPLTGATTAFAVNIIPTIQSDVLQGIGYSSGIATQAATFSTTIRHFYAQQSTFGAGSTVTQQSAFFASSSLIGATENYGFHGTIPSGVGRWNAYMSGTANNALVGSTIIGATTEPNASALLEVSSTAKGFLPPRMTATQASAIASPAEGLMVYVTTTSATFPTKGWYGWNGATWEKLNN